MAYRFKHGESVTEAVRRIAQEQLDKALAEIDDAELSQAKRVHQVRKRCKKIRGLLRLVRPASEKLYQRENAAARDTARALGTLRDAKIMQDSYDGLMDHFQTQVQRQSFGPIRGQLTTQRNAIATETDEVAEIFATARQRLVEMKQRSEKWCFKGKDVATVCDGFVQTYKRARKAIDQIDKHASADEFHELRKRTKYHMYHCRLLRNLWPDVMKAREDDASKLGDLLGDDHDLAVLHDEVAEDPERFAQKETLDAFIGLIGERRSDLEHQSMALAQRLFMAEKKKSLMKRTARYWKIWKKG